MNKHLLFLVLFCFSSSLLANQTNTIEIKKVSQRTIYNSKLECGKVLSAGSFQSCWLTLFHEDKPVRNTEVFINGGMPAHQHGLPTSPRIDWSEVKNVYVIKGLKFSMPGEWSLNFKVNAEDDALKDQITILVNVN
ncbi:MAG: FixH family protein [Cocleimonas sp.]